MSRKKILIIEDDQEMRYALQVRLRMNNYDSVFAADAVMAAAIARKEDPDLILLDLGLPGGDGFVLMERFRNIASLSCIPVIIVSARDAQSNKQKALDAGAVAFFEKPVNNDELLSAISKALGLYK